MAVSAVIEINGVAGSRSDIDHGDLVTFTNQDDTDVLSWQWTLLSRPASSAAVLVNPTSAICTLTADVAGSYLVKLTVVAADPLDNDEDQRVASVRTARAEIRLPAFGEELEAGGRGWEENLNEDLQKISDVFGCGSVHLAVNATGGDLEPGMAVRFTSHTLVGGGQSLPRLLLAQREDPDGVIHGIVLFGKGGPADVAVAHGGQVYVITEGLAFGFVLGTVGVDEGKGVSIGIVPGELEVDANERFIGELVTAGADAAIMVKATRFVRTETYRFTLSGPLDAGIPPFTFDGVRVLPFPAYLVGVIMYRSDPGSAGETRCDVLKNGVSIFALDEDKPAVEPGDTAPVFLEIGEEFDLADIAQVELESAEDDAVDVTVQLVFRTYSQAWLGFVPPEPPPFVPWLRTSGGNVQILFDEPGHTGYFRFDGTVIIGAVDSAEEGVVNASIPGFGALPGALGTEYGTEADPALYMKTNAIGGSLCLFLSDSMENGICYNEIEARFEFIIGDQLAGFISAAGVAPGDLSAADISVLYDEDVSEAYYEHVADGTNTLHFTLDGSARIVLDTVNNVLEFYINDALEGVLNAIGWATEGA